ncbi:hypothetical protein H310_14197 [Aphanomyces invadans]|uniref:Tc1-like transposase DDE domain-containing protein n=1 Tax=Aphanomyces invadans TaxID=157072 RepID=A0A024TCW0_9STRA|nr:hypothetical protein H310_14197 [Aphanomyces invadans]ETV91197.1 hypothetical protein H310_14197 [Aphanomyces invadans]|eukprot:XP_008880228.1 hypothetical protein H310_14197 [Aphanomyces invadans]
MHLPRRSVPVDRHLKRRLAPNAVAMVSLLPTMSKSNAIIVLDNAKYNQGLPDDTPSGSWMKARMTQSCSAYGIELDVKEYRSTLWAKLKAHIEANIVPVIVQMAMGCGHHVVFTPPYHSDLQPIEMIWSYVKGAVGRLYDTTMFSDA